ncbi:LuxR C-terminal-related transcriptional regulator [Kitasatospora paracochleata]|uniref:DNA-binding CsgD family transcriptional regulator n=1 Tax=Kitasatospora paracochleata TaxID=58354 RepID=A0ABT1IXM1_9ACTN|nr:LuxR C-terminal-related transcriptional regulator [Kitasatospora paracochleata]MCP2309894.1 DNA-binding CsgD family transcriptional regulator [Kitasatospora paracochleata]
MTSPSTADPQRTGSPSQQARADAARLLRLLTPREAQVLARLAAGNDPNAVAEQLGLAPATVRTYLQRAMRKLGAGTPAEAVALASALLNPDPAGPAPATDGPDPATRGSAGPDPSAPAAAEPSQAADPGPTPAPAAPAAPAPAPAPARAPLTFPELCANAHARLVQQTFLLTGSRRRAAHCVRLALGEASRRWWEVSDLADPEGWVRARAFEIALSPWRRGGPRRAHRWRLPRRRIRVRPAAAAAAAAEPEASDRPTAHDRALLKALRRLSRPQRRALVLHDTLGLSAAAVAVEVESSTAAAEGRVRAARAALARAVPALVGEDPDGPEFADRLGEALYRAAVHGCPAPRLPSPSALTAHSRLRAGLGLGAAALLPVAMGAAVVTTLLGVGPSSLFRPADEPPAAACTTADTGSAGPTAARAAVSPGIQTPWCSPVPGAPAQFAVVPDASAPPATDGTAPQPTDQPSTQPSPQPSIPPSDQPSGQSSDQPSDQPAPPTPGQAAAAQGPWWPLRGPGTPAAAGAPQGAVVVLPIAVPCASVRPCPVVASAPRLADRLR